MFRMLIVLALSSQMSSAQPTQEEIDRNPVIKQGAQEEKKGNFKAALKLYREAYATEGLRITGLAGIVRAYGKLDEPAHAEEALGEDIKTYPFDLESRLLAAQYYMDHKNFPKALEQLAVAEKIGTGDYRANLKRGMIYQSGGQFEPAIKEYTVYINGDSAAPANVFLWRAQAHFAMQDYAHAEKDAQKALKLEAFSTEILSTYTMILQAQKKYKDAEPLAKQCTDLEPANVGCWDLRGDVGRELKSPGAAGYYGRALTLAPGDLAIRKKLADLLTSLGKFPEADAQYAQLLKLKPDHEVALRSHVESLMKRRSFGPAAKVLGDFHQSNPKNLWAGLEFAKLLTFVGQNDRAVAVLKTTRKSNKSEVADMYYGHALYLSGNYSSAEDAIEDIKDPKLAKDFNLGVTYMSLKKWAKAVKHFDKVQPGSPGQMAAQVNKAIALRQDGKIDAALQALTQTSFPADMQPSVQQYTQYLNELKSRSPSSKDAAENSPIKPYLDWELPQL